MKYLLLIIAVSMDPLSIKTLEMTDKATCEMAKHEIHAQMLATVETMTDGLPDELQTYGGMKALGIGMPPVMACIKQ